MIRLMLAVLCAAIPLGFAAADEAIKEKLEAAKTAYTADAEKSRKAVAALLDEREAKARNEGNKTLVDQIKIERRAFEDKGEWPKSTPTAVRTQFAAARSKMEQAFKTAVSDCIKAKMDDEAAMIEKELANFRLGGPAIAGRLEERLTSNVWATPKGPIEFKPNGAFHINGKKFGHWVTIPGNRVVTVADDGNHFDVYVFDKDLSQFQAYYIGQPGGVAGFGGKPTPRK
ncbi:hypothetical protein [Zavarzinella formosa]|uniref:hypothetical protein n=1 Tax=Zavarzinella formosa TaxID=360055 RepID=UPI00031D6C1F|nr:hypothetical protein [Zavarzinella formosa]